VTDEDQYQATIHIADTRGELHGCAFIVDSTHVMTCAHVVRFCSDADAVATNSPGFYVLGLKDGATFRLRLVPDADCTDNDIAVLVLDTGERFHEHYRVVTWEPCQAQLAYRGSGLIEGGGGKGTVQPVEIDGTTGGLASPTRYSVTATQKDLRVEPGCSGGAVFAKSGQRALIGMVAEYRQDLSGTIIHAQALRDTWPTLRRAGPRYASSFADISPRPGPKGIALADLDDTIGRCDREMQTDPFRDHMRVLEKSRRGALLTTVHGTPQDLPDLLCTRLCTLGPQSLVRRSAVDTTKLLPRPTIDMATCNAPNARGMREKVEYRLQDKLNSAQPSIPSFVREIRKLGRPLALEVSATETFIAEKGELAVRVWTRIAADLSEADLGYPVFIFFVVIHSGAAEGIAAMQRWTAREKSFLVLNELAPVTLKDIESWSQSCYGPRVAGQIMNIVGANVGGSTGIRLKQLQDWLTSEA